MAEITNLNRFRKRRARAEAATQADANRVKFGRTKAEKAAETMEAARRREALDGAKRDDDRS